MKNSVIAILAVFSIFSVYASNIKLEMSTDSLIIKNVLQGGIFYPADSIVFTNIKYKQPYIYNENCLKYGIHFRNQATTTVLSNITLTPVGSSDWWNPHTSVIFGVEGKNTVAVLRCPSFRGDNKYTKTSIALFDGGRLVVGKEVNADLVFPDYGNYTRQWWVYGDGTGVLELEDGLIADRSANGTIAESFGSIRLNNVTLITHNSASLPSYKMTDDYNPAKVGINGHLVFENNPGKWIVDTRAQDYNAGVQLTTNLTVETRYDLTLSGNTFYWSNKNYYNYGSVFFYSNNLTLTKTGGAKLVISGDMGCNLKSAINVQEGTLEFKISPYIAGKAVPAGLTNGRNLSVNIANTSKLLVNTDSISVHGVFCSKAGFIESGLLSTIIADSISANGELTITNSRLVNLKAGDVFRLFKAINITGKFENIHLPALDNSLAWDTTQLYSAGIISVKTATSVRSVSSDVKNTVLFPNPAEGYMAISALEPMHTITIRDITGKFIAEYDAGNSTKYTMHVAEMRTGTYLVNIRFASGNSAKQLLLKK